MIHAKVTAATAAAAASQILVYVVEQFGPDLPAAVEGALATLMVFAAGYLKSA
jgi:hypothetical protein